jgi:hypothetical protein
MLPMAFDISVGVTRGASGLRDEIDSVLRTRRQAIERILDEYGVPRGAGSAHAG